MCPDIAESTRGGAGMVNEEHLRESALDDTPHAASVMFGGTGADGQTSTGNTMLVTKGDTNEWK